MVRVRSTTVSFVTRDATASCSRAWPSSASRRLAGAAARREVDGVGALRCAPCTLGTLPALRRALCVLTVLTLDARRVMAPTPPGVRRTIMEPLCCAAVFTASSSCFASTALARARSLSRPPSTKSMCSICRCSSEMVSVVMVSASNSKSLAPMMTARCATLRSQAQSRFHTARCGTRA
jgi:hypothetical protein